MGRRGWFRLWIVATVIGVPAAAEWNFQNEQATWDQIEKPTIQLCVDQEFNSPSHPDALECGHKAGTDKTIFEHEGMTPTRFWSQTLAIFFVLDLVLTALLIGAFVVIRWVVQGFRDDAHSSGSRTR